MDGPFALALQEAGIISVISEAEARDQHFDAYILPPEELSHPRDRFNHVADVLQSWKDRTPKLLEPGISLCLACRNISIDALESKEGCIHSECYWALVASAEVSECPMCDMMVKALRGTYPADFDIGIKLLNPFLTDVQVGLRAVSSEKRSNWDNLEVLVLNTRPLLPPGRLCMFTLPGTTAANRGYPQHRFADDAQKYATMRRWLREQYPERREHSGNECQPHESLQLYPVLPTRVIDVGLPLDAMDEDVRLVNTEDLASKRAPYIALSYRWGECNRLTTTKLKIRDRRQRIPLKEMPRTLQDAVIVTRRLQVRYLWIDALCIIQDDKDDWVREAARMGEIYMNSFCTIAAHAAQHADHGFLRQSLSTPRVVRFSVSSTRKVWDDQPKDRLKGELTIDESGPQYHTQPSPRNVITGQQVSTTSQSSQIRVDLFIVSGGSNVKLHVGGSQLSSRGWVVQELLLSPRTLHFADDGAIYFESSTGFESAEGIREPHYQHQFKTVRSMVKQLAQATLQNGQKHCELRDGEVPISLTTNAVFQSWYEIVEHLSRCSLTKPEDKLPALIGIVRQMHAFTKDNCYVGLWSKRIPQCLLWLRGEETLRLHSRYHAPSWSWAVHDGEIQFPLWNSKGDDTSIRAEFVEAIFIYGPQSNGEKVIGFIDGRAALFMRGVNMIRNSSFPTGHPSGGTGLRFLDGQIGKPAWIQICNWEPLKTKTRFWTVHDDTGRRIGWAALDREDRTEIDGEEDMITCIKIASHADDKPKNGFVRGYLVLFITRFLHTWIRVGMGQITEIGWFENIPPVDILFS